MKPMCIQQVQSVGFEIKYEKVWLNVNSLLWVS